MNKRTIGNFMQKHYKKLLPLLFLVPTSAKSQNLEQEINSAEFKVVEVIDTTNTHPKYDPQLKPYVAETHRDLPQMSAGQAIINNHKTYVGYFDYKGELQVLRTDCRYSAAAPDILTGVFRAECAHYNKRDLAKRHLEGRVPHGFTTDEYYQYVKDANNSLGEVIRDYCNFRKKRVGQNSSIVVRAGFFQGGINEWSACLRAAFCSPDENAQKFAANFIDCTPENLAIRDSVINTVYNKNGELIDGEEGVQKRIKIRPLLEKIKVKGLRGSAGFSEKFCDSLRYYTQKQKFNNEGQEFQHRQMFESIKKLQENYVLAWYLLAATACSSATGIDNYVASEFEKKTGKKISVKEVKKRGLGIHIPPGKILGFIESNINGGPYFKGFYPGTNTILKSFMVPFDKNKLLTQEFLRQAKIVGISGAKEAYKKFMQKLEILQREEQVVIKKIERQADRNPAPNDAIKAPYRIEIEHKPVKIKLR